MLHKTLNNGVEMPMLGYGVFQTPPEETARCVAEALEVGYRLIDTAQAYANEEGVGAAVRASGVPREEVFITSKIWVANMNYERATASIDESLRKLDTDYIDLMLLHQAMGDYPGAYRAMEDAYKAGKLRAIGVSNFYPNVLANFCETVRIIPAVNQIELHPWYVQSGALDTMKHYGVVPEAWAPLGGGRYAFEDETLLSIGRSHGKTAGQVMLRWNVQRGVVVIPKSVHAERMQENMDIWDFSLTDEEMDRISSLDMGYTGSRAKHFDPDFVRMCLHRTL